MIYLDNAATTFPKPISVINSVKESFSYSANPGRSGHKMSIAASEKIYDCRSKICELFNFDSPERVLLTSSCTFSLNTVIKGILQKGDHVVISSLEHNSVLRPLETLKSRGIITYDIAEVFEGDDDKTLDSFRKHFRDNTKLVICTHASNVFGVKLPVSRICALCHFYDILFCLDAAQTAGIINIDMKEFNPDFVCAPGHKGLYGPMGTGLLIINTDNVPESLVEGGTGSGSSEYTQPDMLPDKFESGTQNLHGIAGLATGIDFVISKKTEKIVNHEMHLINWIYNEFSNMKSVEIYTKKPHIDTHVPLLSFNIKDMYSEEVADYLNKYYRIFVRAGLHCSPLAHKSYATINRGTVRICPSAFTSFGEAKQTVNAVNKLIQNKKIFI